LILRILDRSGTEPSSLAMMMRQRGADLARVSAESAEEAISNLAYLRPRRNLMRGELLQPCGGWPIHSCTSDDRTLAGTEYELTEKGS